MEGINNSAWTNDNELGYQVTVLVMKINFADPGLISKINKSLDPDKRSAYISYLKSSAYAEDIKEMAKQFDIEADLLYDKIAAFYRFTSEQKKNV